MSVAEAAHRPARAGRSAVLWIGFLIVIAAAIGLAWAGAGSLRPTVTASGLQFRVVKEGAGDPIGANDAALMDYVLTVGDKLVDSSENHGGAQPFSMSGVFPGFAEAMTRMREGGVYRFTMPPRLAFGSGPPPQGFPGGDLTFEVQVRKVVRGGAGMMQNRVPGSGG